MQPNGDAPPLDYLEALKARTRQVEVLLGGKKIAIRRARLGLALRLFDLQERATDVIGFALPYVSMASGVPEEQIDIQEVGEAFRKVFEMNKPVGIAPLALFSTGPSKTPPAFAYRGRGAAAFVHELAMAYGWSSDDILEGITPEEAWCYVQEIEHTRHDERRFAYQLSDVGRDRKGRQKPFSDPPWFMLGVEALRPVRTDRRKPRRAPPRPTGTIINRSPQRRRP